MSFNTPPLAVAQQSHPLIQSPIERLDRASCIDFVLPYLSPRDAMTAIGTMPQGRLIKQEMIKQYYEYCANLDKDGHDRISHFQHPLVTLIDQYVNSLFVTWARKDQKDFCNLATDLGHTKDRFLILHLARTPQNMLSLLFPNSPNDLVQSVANSFENDYDYPSRYATEIKILRDYVVLRQVGYQANRIAERLLATLNSLPGMEECLEHVLQTPSLHNQEIVLEDRVVDNFAIDLTLNSSKRRAMRLFLTTVTCKFNDMCYYRRLTTSLEKVILFLSRDPEGTSLIKSILISYMPPPDNNYLSERVVNNLALEWVKKPEMAEQLHLLIKKRHVDLATATLFQLSFQQPADSQISALIKKTLDARLQTNEHI